MMDSHNLSGESLNTPFKSQKISHSIFENPSYFFHGVERSIWVVKAGTNSYSICVSNYLTSAFIGVAQPPTPNILENGRYRCEF